MIRFAIQVRDPETQEVWTYHTNELAEMEAFTPLLQNARLKHPSIAIGNFLFGTVDGGGDFLENYDGEFLELQWPDEIGS